MEKILDSQKQIIYDDLFVLCRKRWEINLKLRKLPVQNYEKEFFETFKRCFDHVVPYIDARQYKKTFLHYFFICAKNFACNKQDQKIKESQKEKVFMNAAREHFEMRVAEIIDMEDAVSNKQISEKIKEILGEKLFLVFEEEDGFINKYLIKKHFEAESKSLCSLYKKKLPLLKELLMNLRGF